MKYDALLGDLKNQLANVKKAAVLLPAILDTDTLSAGLSLMLALRQSGKDVAIVTQHPLTVNHAILYGVGEVKNNLPAESSGNFVLSLSGVVDNQGLVPALEKLDWYPEGDKLNLVFHVAAGKTFQPSEITSSYKNSGYNMFFVVGAANINDLGVIYQQNQEMFGKAPIVNIDKNPSNGKYGWINVIDTDTSSISEMMVTFISSLGFLIDADIASNILVGIYEATGGLTHSVKPDTFMAAGLALQSGGKIPTGPASTSTQGLPIQTTPVVEPQPVPQPQMQYQSPQQIVVPTPVQDQPVPQPQVSQSTPQMTQQQIPVAQAPIQDQPIVIPNPPSQPDLTQTQQGPGLDLRQIFNIPGAPGVESQPLPESQPQTVSTPNSQSTQETPSGEYVSTGNMEAPQTPTPDWLVPKIFKGGSLG